MSNQDFTGTSGNQSHDEKSEASISWQPRMPVHSQPMMLTPGYLQASLRQPCGVTRLTGATPLPLAPGTTPLSLAPRLPVQVIGGSAQHGNIVKTPVASIAVLTSTNDSGRAVTSSLSAPSSNVVVTPAISHLQPLSMQAPGYTTGSGIIHAQPLSSQVAMASLIRGAMPASVLPSVQTRPHQATHQITPAAVGQAYLSHVPRGAIAASALSSPKSVAMTTAVLRPCPPGSGVVVTTSTQGPRAMLPISRAASPVITLHATQPGLPQSDAQRLVLGSRGPSPGMQISLQPPPRPIEHSTRTILSHIVAPKPSQPLLHSSLPYHPTVASGQKVLVAPATAPVQLPASSATQAKLGCPGVTFNVATPLSALTQPQKVITAHASSSRHPQQSIVQGQQFGLSQFSQHQKVIMTQSSTPQPLQVTISGATVSKSAGSVTALNLTQPLSRMPQKMAASISVPATLTATSAVVSLSVSRPAVPLVPSAISTTVNSSSLTSITTVAASVIPIAKVTPQRQQQPDSMARVDSQHQQQASGQVTSGQPAGLYIPHPVTAAPAHRPPSASTIVTVHSDNRPATVQRSAFTPHLPYTIPPEYYRASIVNYPNFVYPRVAAPTGQTHPFAALTSGSTIRPNIVSVPGQNPNLATALQVAAHSVTTSVAPAVRISHNPMMVTVNPRHPSLTVRAHYSPVTQSVSRSASDLTVSAPPCAPHGSISQGSMPHGNAGPPSSGTLPQSTSANSYNPTASPRPSILRKRTNDGVTVVKKNLMGTASPRDSNSPMTSSSLPPATPPKPSVPCDASRENSQSSTDTASSVESTPLAMPLSEVKIKQESVDPTENAANTSAPFSLLGSTMPKVEEASPRKKPRKQLLNANEELKDENSSDEDDDFSAKVKLKRELEKVAEDIQNEDIKEYVDEDGIRWVKERKRPSHLLLDYYDCTWKAKLNHFVKPTDVKPKEERQLTVNELANERKVYQTASGWKLYHLASQLEELVELETTVSKAMREIQESIAPTHIAKHTLEDDIGMVHELTQGNIQRSQLVADQLAEAKTSMLNVLNHKQRILEVINKHHSKRPVKKKERN